MQQGLMLMLLMMVVLPIVILFSNHDVFFILIAIILFVSSALSIRRRIMGIHMESDEDDSEMIEEMEDFADIDLEKFGTGTKVMRHAIAVVFFVYTSFYVEALWLRILTALVIVYWVYKIMEDILKSDSVFLPVGGKKIRDFCSIVVSSSSLLIIVTAFLNKFVNLNP